MKKAISATTAAIANGQTRDQECLALILPTELGFVDGLLVAELPEVEQPLRGEPDAEVERRLQETHRRQEHRHRDEQPPRRRPPERERDPQEEHRDHQAEVAGLPPPADLGRTDVAHPGLVHGSLRHE